MPAWLAVALGSALGGVARHACGVAAAAWLGDGFPVGTILVNVVGSFVIGFFATLTGSEGRLLVRPAGRVFVMVGFCGGFSSFSLQTFLLLRGGAWVAAAGNVALSMALCLLAVWLGHAGAATVNRPPSARSRARR